jgi:hypothetical protein
MNSVWYFFGASGLILLFILGYGIVQCVLNRNADRRGDGEEIPLLAII